MLKKYKFLVTTIDNKQLTVKEFGTLAPQEGTAYCAQNLLQELNNKDEKFILTMEGVILNKDYIKTIEVVDAPLTASIPEPVGNIISVIGTPSLFELYRKEFNIPD